jgi:hypothetical protein
MVHTGQSVGTIGETHMYPGDHIVVFFRGRAERDQLVKPYLRDGLAAGHVCFFMANEGEQETFRTMITDRADGPLEVAGSEGYYLDRGTFQPDVLLGRLYDWSNETFARSAGFARIGGDMAWALPLIAPDFIADLMEYEVQVTRWVRSYPQVNVCLYDLDHFGGDLVIPLVKTHAKMWLNGVLVDNPYYLDPDGVPA